MPLFRISGKSWLAVSPTSKTLPSGFSNTSNPKSKSVPPMDFCHSRRPFASVRIIQISFSPALSIASPSELLEFPTIMNPPLASVVILSANSNPEPPNDLSHTSSPSSFNLISQKSDSPLFLETSLSMLSV